MAETYTSNQTGVIACSAATSMWGIVQIGESLQVSGAIHPFYVITVLIAWILIPFIIKRIRVAYIVGVIVWIIFYVGDVAIESAFLGAGAWWTFSAPWAYPYFVGWLVGIAWIYFAYKSYMELKK